MNFCNFNYEDRDDTDKIQKYQLSKTRLNSEYNFTKRKSVIEYVNQNDLLTPSLTRSKCTSNCFMAKKEDFL